MENNDGFGIVQLLVVTSAAALLCSLVIFISGSYRDRTWDVRRISDVGQIREGLELYYAHASGYPDKSSWLISSEVTCEGAEVLKIPKDPEPGFFYNYKGVGNSSKGCGNQTIWTGYQLQFQTATESTLGPAGIYCMRPTLGITSGACPQL